MPKLPEPPACKHLELEFVGDQKTEDGINTYYRCKSCHDILFVTPQQKTYRIKHVK